MADFLQVSTAAATREEASTLADAAVQARLAGNAQVIGPVRSSYWHLGEFGTSEEWQVVMRTTAEVYPELEEHLISAHPWDNPEIIAVPIVAGAAACLDWLRSSVALS